MTIEELRPFQEKTVVLHMRNGEIATVKVELVDCEYEDIIVEVVETNVPHLYARPIESCAFTFPAAEIEFVEQITTPGK